MSDNGLSGKFIVHRTDGDPKGKHEYCRYFVLDPDHDEHARTALLAYAEATKNHRLATQLRAWAQTFERSKP